MAFITKIVWSFYLCLDSSRRPTVDDLIRIVFFHTVSVIKLHCWKRNLQLTRDMYHIYSILVAIKRNNYNQWFHDICEKLAYRDNIGSHTANSTSTHYHLSVFKIQRYLSSICVFIVEKSCICCICWNPAKGRLRRARFPKTTDCEFNRVDAHVFSLIIQRKLTSFNFFFAPISSHEAQTVAKR